MIRAIKGYTILDQWCRESRTGETHFIAHVTLTLGLSPFPPTRALWDTTNPPLYFPSPPLTVTHLSSTSEAPWGPIHMLSAHSVASAIF